MTKSEEYCINKGYKSIGLKICVSCQCEFQIFLNRDINRKRFCSKECLWISNGKSRKDKYSSSCTTPIKSKIKRSIHSIEWKNSVLQKSNGKCVKCGENGKHAHHIKPFKTILKEFLLSNTNLDPIKDKVELFKLAINYKDFWNIDNGIYLCISCHQKEHPELTIPMDRNPLYKTKI